MKERENFSTVEEMYRASQIPEEILRNMDTASLLETCLDYPLLVNLSAFDTLQDGFIIVAQNFNGISEFLRREDAAAVLVSYYKNKDYGVITKEDMTEDQKGDFILQSILPEIILAQDEIIGSMSSDDRRVLIKQTLSQFEEKAKYPDYYGFLSLSPTGLIMKRVMENEGFNGYSKENRENTDVDEHNIQQVLSDAQKFIE